MMNISLAVPDEMSYQLVYRKVLEAPLQDSRVGIQFVHLTGLGDALTHSRRLSRQFGLIGIIKAIAKLCTGRRSLYLAMIDDGIVSHGWCTRGSCVHYHIEPDAVVIGPIWTSESVRGRGIATQALKLAINELYRRGTTVFYIDTEKTNKSAQRVFEKCGFGLPLALFIRPKNVAL